MDEGVGPEKMQECSIFVKLDFTFVRSVLVPYYDAHMKTKAIQRWWVGLLVMGLIPPLGAQENENPEAPPPPPEAPAAETPDPPPPPPVRLDLVIQKGKTKKKTSSSGRQETYQFELTVKNLEPARELKDAVINLYVLGQDVLDRNLYNLVYHNMGVITVPPLKEAEFECDSFYLKYTDSSGTEFGGYVITVEDALGNLQLIKSTNVKFEKQLDTIREKRVSKTKTYSFRLD